MGTRRSRSHPDDGRAPQPTRRLLLRAPAALAVLAATLVAGGRVTAAAVCAPRGAGCSTFRPCCDGSPCRVFAANPAAGLCPGHGAVALLRGHSTLWTPARLRRGLFASAPTCADFRTRREVRRYIRRHPGLDTSRLADDDGRICRDLPRG